ncbi:phosphatidylserine decarboxylase [Vibrio maritimus]|uniref:Phosphatidylserine decarboxylase n=1 Tax=Vibrio maritimus TaxID=990268 RepID=A0A090TDA0_9VIBR|nr:phosphatidylserine decarboxylase [Vibrio maritimus]
MGRFKLGSTVINLFAKDSIRFDDSMENNAPTVMGTPFAHALGLETEASETETDS